MLRHLEAAARRLEARGVKVDGDGEANEQESKAVAASSESLRRQKLGEHGEIMPAVRRTWLTLSAEAAILGEDSAAVELLNGYFWSQNVDFLEKIVPADL